MLYSTDGKNERLLLGKAKRWFSFKCLEGNGNLKIEYLIDKHIYILSRTDGKVFDGTEDVGGEFYGNMTKPETIEEIVEYEVNLLTAAQIEPEVNLFEEFDWKYNEDKTKIIICPVFKKDKTTIDIKLPTSEEGEVCLSFGVRKRVRTKL